VQQLEAQACAVDLLRRMYTEQQVIDQQSVRQCRGGSCCRAG
jgi:hypothetical protein